MFIPKAQACLVAINLNVLTGRRLAALALVASQSWALGVQEPKYKRDCWQKRPVSLAQGANVPGAGIDKFTPFETVEKDGFLEADCIKDYMYSYGDKFGDNKFSYKLEKTSNVSIVHYSSHVAKEDRKAMTPTVCFEFCRTVPHMGFFGIVNGRDCYCTPYYKPMESGSSNCDATCEGEATLFCGGKEKSTVFSMHMCADTAQDLSDAAGKAGAMKSDLSNDAGDVKKLSEGMQNSAAKLQASFGQVGDSATTNLLQSAKVFAGDLLHSAEDAEKIATKLGDLEADAKKIKAFTDPKDVTKAERIMEDIDATVAKGKKADEELADLRELANVSNPSAGAGKQYYPVMYFVDKEFDSVPSTCGGETMQKPMLAESADDCAHACDAPSPCDTSVAPIVCA